MLDLENKYARGQRLRAATVNALIDAARASKQLSVAGNGSAAHGTGSIVVRVPHKTTICLFIVKNSVTFPDPPYTEANPDVPYYTGEWIGHSPLLHRLREEDDYPFKRTVTLFHPTHPMWEDPGNPGTYKYDEEFPGFPTGQRVSAFWNTQSGRWEIAGPPLPNATGVFALSTAWVYPEDDMPSATGIQYVRDENGDLTAGNTQATIRNPCALWDGNAYVGLPLGHTGQIVTAIYTNGVWAACGPQQTTFKGVLEQPYSGGTTCRVTIGSVTVTAGMYWTVSSLPIYHKVMVTWFEDDSRFEVVQADCVED